LEFVVAVFLEAGGFEEAGEGQLAPVAKDFVVAFEGAGEVVGFLAEVAALGGEEFDLLFEGAALLEVGGVDVFDFFAEVGDAFGEGGEEGLEASRFWVVNLWEWDSRIWLARSWNWVVSSARAEWRVSSWVWRRMVSVRARAMVAAVRKCSMAQPRVRPRVRLPRVIVRRVRRVVCIVLVFS